MENISKDKANDLSESICKNIKLIKENLQRKARLIAVSKTKPMHYIELAYKQGQLLFGENKALEMRDKYYALPKDIEWHFIGHLQTNKIKYIAPFVSLIHSIDSLNLLIEVNKQAKKNDRVIPCLLQVYIAQEETKYGLSIAEVEELLRSEDYALLNNISIHGLMGMATNTDNTQQIKAEFASLKAFFQKLKAEFFSGDECFKEISMGMTEDYKIAVEEGSTMVRVGSAIFGQRIYL